MQIRRLLVEHVKGVKRIEIHAKDVNELAGPCASGKTTVLDSISWALGGKGRLKDPVPVRLGKTQGRIEIDTEDFQLVRTLNENGQTRLVVRGKDGGRYGQTNLDSWLSDLTFDPTEFARWPMARQVEALRALAGTQWNEKLKFFDSMIDDTFDDRRLKGRELKGLGELLREPERVDLGEVKAERERLQERALAVSQVERLREKRAGIMIRVGEATERIKDNQAAIERLKKEIERMEGHRMALLGEADHVTKQIHEVEAEGLLDAGGIKAQMAALDKKIEGARAWEAWDRKRQEREAVEKSHGELDKQLQKLRVDREEHLRSLPLPGELGIQILDEGFSVKGVPFVQLSGGERIKISARVGMSLYSELRIMLVQNGEAMDQDVYEALVEVAREEKVQLWIATVGEGHGDAIFLEAGELVGVETMTEGVLPGQGTLPLDD